MRIWCKPMFGALALVLLMPCSSRAAAAPPAKIVVTFGGLNERSGVLFVAKDAGIFQKHGLDADVVGVRSGPVGMAALAAGETQFHGGSATGASIGAMVSGDQSVTAQALATGGIIDGAYLGYTFGPQLERQGFRVLGDLLKMGIPFQGLGIMGRRSFVDRSPDVVERTLRAMVETVRFINNPENKATVIRSLVRTLRLQKAEDAEPGYEMMKTLYDRRIYPNVEGLRHVIRLLGKSNEQIRKLRAEDLIDDRVVRKLEKEGLF